MADIQEWCPLCESNAPAASYRSCYLCSRRFCENCSVKAGGREFCGKLCADNYFFADDDDDGDVTGLGDE